MDTDAHTKSIVDEQQGDFEKMVLNTIIYNREFFNKIRDVLCVDPTTRAFTDEFEHPLDNAIYRMFTQYNACFSGAPNIPMLSLDFARMLMNKMVKEGEGLTNEGEVDEAIDRLLEIMQINPLPVGPVVNNGFIYWLKKSRYARSVSSSTARGDWDPEKVLTFTQMQVDAVAYSNADDFFFEFGHGVTHQLLNIKRLSSGLPPLDNALNGGFGYQEAALFVAPQGSGKTVLGCQLAQTWASMKLPGVLFTTEQPHEQLEPRIISNACRIPFKLIADKVDLRALSLKQQDDYHQLQEQLHKYCVIYDWCRNKSLSILTNFDDIIKRAQDKFGGLHWFVFDWIGGGLGEMGINKDEIRQIYQRTGDKIAQACFDHDICGAAFAQADMTTGVNNPRVGARCISECKSIGRNMSTGIGITAMYEKNDMEEGQKPIFAKRQAFYVFKARKGEDRSVPVMRQFDFQRFASGF